MAGSSQQALLFPRRGRPLRRDRDDPNVAAKMHRVRAPIVPRHPVHLILKLAAPRSLRQRAANRQVRSVLSALSEARLHFRITAYSLLDDHLHFIVEGDTHEAFVSGVRSLAIRVARRLNPVLRRKGRLVSQVYFRRELRTPTEVRNALRYVLLNFRGHVARGRSGTCSTPDRFSSGGWFDGWSIDVGHDPEPCAVSPPKTWLARVGWRRHGLISPFDIPGPL